jgi:hypothetical protein
MVTLAAMGAGIVLGITYVLATNNQTSTPIKPIEPDTKRPQKESNQADERPLNPVNNKEAKRSEENYSENLKALEV